MVAKTPSSILHLSFSCVRIRTWQRGAKRQNTRHRVDRGATGQAPACNMAQGFSGRRGLGTRHDT
jgi:hypothetical protein